MRTLLLLVMILAFNHNAFCDDDAYVDDEYNSEDSVQDSLSEAEEYVEDTFVVQTIDYDSFFAKKYKGESFQYREDRGMVFEATKKSGGSIWNLLLDLLMYLIIGAVIIYLIYFLIQIIRGANFQIPKSVSAAKTFNKNEVKVEKIDDVDFKKLINEAKQAKDFKMAVRYYFLWYLKLLTADNYIKWNKDKSNTDYKNELRGTARLDEFSLLAYLYEWVWYGNVSLDEEKFAAVESHFLSKIVVA